jgi:hypothetical protein
MANLLRPTNDASLLNPAAHTGRSTSCIEKLSKLFIGTDFVKVINPDTEPFVWQWLPPHKEEVSFTDGSVPMKITHRGDPEVWKLEGGQSGTIVGSNAYVMIDGLVKRMMSKKAIARQPNTKPGENRNFNFSDDIAQQEWINVIYLGVDNPYEQVASVEVPTDQEVNRQIDDDLGLTNAKVEESTSDTRAKREQRTNKEIQAALS